MSVALSLVLAALNWGGIDRVNVEAGDFAANSLQALQAKASLLTEGHYSRFGFHHPGPALLYVLAISELIFFDALGLVPSAFSAQLLAVAILNAVSITTVIFMLRRLTGRWLSTLFAVTAFLVTLAWMNDQVFTSAWFPYMYALPFAAFLAALAAVVRGFAIGLPFAAVFGGLLINGHASFLFIVPLVAVLVLAINAFTARDSADARILSRSWLTANIRSVVTAAILFVLLLTPLAWRLLRDWPSPIADYLSNGGGTGQRDVVAGVGAFLANPRGSWVVIVALATLIAVIVFATRHRAMRDAAALAWVLLAASAVHAAYNLVGVDDPANSYLTFYFLVVPALAPAVIIVALGRQFSRAGATLPIAVLTTIGLIYAMAEIRTTAWPVDYQRADVLALQETIGDGVTTTVLDLDSTQDWGAVWSTTAGYLLLEQRQGSPRVCVRENWFIGFTDEARCTDADIATGQIYRVSSQGGAITVTPAGN